MLPNNFLAVTCAFGLAILWLRLNDFLAHKGWITSWLSRKIIHIGTGPIFVASWLFFRDQALARYLAALIPFAITAQFALVGLGIVSDQAAVKAMSRTGDRKEILRGPLFYGLAFIALTLLYWKESPIGIIALMLMCGGDGLAEILGKRFGTTPLPWSKKKSWAGLMGMIAGGWLFSIGILALYVSAGVFPGPFSGFLFPVTLITLAAAAVESLPLEDIDNITIPLVAVLLGHFFF